MKKWMKWGALLTFYDFSLSVMLYCLNRMRPTLEERGLNHPLELADAAREKLDRARQLTYDWEKQKNQDPFRRQGARELDDRIDRALSQIADTAERFDDMEVDTEASRLGGELHSDLFPNGVFHITSQTFDEQHMAVEELTDRLTDSYGEHLDALSLQPLVDRLEELNERFGEKLTPREDRVDYDEVEAATVEAREAFHTMVVCLMGEYCEDLETFNEIIAPIREQTERARRHYSRSGRVPEVDPETGEPVEPTGETDDNPQNDGGSSDGETDTENDTDSDGDSEVDGETEVDDESDTDEITDDN